MAALPSPHPSKQASGDPRPFETCELATASSRLLATPSVPGAQFVAGSAATGAAVAA